MVIWCFRQQQERNMKESIGKPEMPSGDRLLHMKIPHELKRWLRKEADRENRTMSNFVINVLIQAKRQRDKHTE